MLLPIHSYHILLLAHHCNVSFELLCLSLSISAVNVQKENEVYINRSQVTCYECAIDPALDSINP